MCLYTSGTNQVKVGDIFTSDKKYISPDKLTSDIKPIGVVSFIHKEDGKPNIIGLHQNEKRWCNRKPNVLFYGRKVPINVTNYADAFIDFNGRDYTDALKNNFGEEINEFPSLKYCLDYNTEGTNKGDWFFMSSGEVLQTIRNVLVINDTIQRINDVSGKETAEPIAYHEWYCSIAVCDYSSIWICYSGNVSLDLWHYYDKRRFTYVRPALR